VQSSGQFASLSDGPMPRPPNGPREPVRDVVMAGQPMQVDVTTLNHTGKPVSALSVRCNSRKPSSLPIESGKWVRRFFDRCNSRRFAN